MGKESGRMRRTAADGWTRLGEIPKASRDKIARWIRVAYPDMQRATLQALLGRLASVLPEESEPMDLNRAREAWEAMRPDNDEGGEQ